MRRYTGQGAVVFAGTLVVLGMGLIIASGRNAAGTAFIPTQLSYLVSGGLVGLVLVGVGLAIANAHMTRTAAAEERHALASVLDATAVLVDRVTEQA